MDSRIARKKININGQVDHTLEGTNSDYAFEYDLMGNRIAAQRQTGAPQSETFPAAGGGTTTIAATPVKASGSTYDNLNQLTARSSSGTVPVRISGRV